MGQNRPNCSNVLCRYGIDPVVGTFSPPMLSSVSESSQNDASIDIEFISMYGPVTGFPPAGNTTYVPKYGICMMSEFRANAPNGNLFGTVPGVFQPTWSRLNSCV